MPQGMNLEAKVGETGRHNVGGTGETRALKIRELVEREPSGWGVAAD